MYEIKQIPELSLLDIHAFGLWDAKIADNYRADMALNLQEIAGWAGFNVLLRVEDGSILPKSVAQTVQESITDQKRAGLRKCAYVIGSTLQGLQAKRLFDNDEHVKVFSQPDAALDWLNDSVAR